MFEQGFPFQNSTKRLHDTENYCGYLISLDLAKPLLCEIHLSSRPSQDQSLKFKSLF